MNRTEAIVPTVVIIQTSQATLMSCAKELAATDLHGGQDFYLTGNPNAADMAITATRRQMLVTGSFVGDQAATDIFVRRMKKRNPQLRVALFSANNDGPVGEPYDMVIPKGRDGRFCDALVIEIHRFIAGGE